MKMFPSSEATYDHMQDLFGGNGLGHHERDGYDELEETDEEDWEADHEDLEEAGEDDLAAEILNYFMTERMGRVGLIVGGEAIEVEERVPQVAPTARMYSPPFEERMMID